MKANKRVRDLKRVGQSRLTYTKDGASNGTTTYPTIENRVRREERK